MKFKRILSLLLTFLMLLSCSVNVLAINVNMNIDGDNVVQVETNKSKFFNIQFAPPEYEPNAEQVYVMHMGLSYDMWRYSGGMNTR